MVPGPTPRTRIHECIGFTMFSPAIIGDKHSSPLAMTGKMKGSNP